MEMKAENFGKEANKIGPAIDKASHDVGKTIGSAVGKVSNQTTQYVQATREYVSENPLQSVAIVAAAGVAVGSLLTMLTRKSH